MNKKIYFSTMATLFSIFLLASCAEDKGNYEYADKEIITIDDIPEQISVLANAEHLTITPTITSNLRGSIENDSQYFEFSCERKEDDKWIEMCTAPNVKDINMLADIETKVHTCRYSVIDKETGVRYSKLFTINATTVTTEGWILLCNEQSSNKVRVDMLSHLSIDRILPAYNVVKFSEEVPELYNGRSISFHSSRAAWGNKIIMTSETGSYLIPCAGNHFGYGEIQEVTGVQELKMNLFLSTPEDHIIKTVSIPCQWYTHDAIIGISSEGNAFVWDHTQAGAGFEYPVNTSARGEETEFKVAPYVGTPLDRYWTLQWYGIALLYDIDNKRFIGWDGENDNQGSRKQVTYVLNDPSDSEKLFSFNTGMDLVCMLNTLSRTHCIMQDGNKRHIYSINVMTKEFKQEGFYPDIQAEHFNDATKFAASSQYPVIYYAYQNKVYSYNYATGENKKAIELDSNEEITMLKFNRYDEVWGTDYLINATEVNEFKARENELIVASYNSTATNDNGGILRFYQTTSPGVDLTLKPGWEYTGFAKIVDAVYKEVRR